MAVGIRDLKKRLSEYLERAARGEIIQVTDRGKPKAVLGPVPGQLQLREGIEQKWIRPGSGQLPRPVPRCPARVSITEVLDEDRGD